MKALGINIFGGGFTSGMVEAGHKVIGQWEECNAHSKTFDLNFKGIPHPLEYTDWPILDTEPEIIYSNPPCAPWSNANAVKTVDNRRITDPRLNMTARTMQTAMALRPKFFVCESVSQAYTRGADYYRDWAQRWISLGYGVTFLLTDAILHGSPSERQRFHFIAHKNKLSLQQPDMKTFMPKTVRMAIGDLVHNLGGKYPNHFNFPLRKDRAKVIRACPPGGKPSKYGNCFAFISHRLFWESPSLTIIDTGKVIHPESNRMVTVREAMRLLTYPDNFLVHEVSPTASSLTQAVMPLVGKYIGELAKASIQSRQPANRELSVVNWLDLAKPYRQSAVLRSLNELC